MSLNRSSATAVHNVILCGGVGSRLWPLSRKSRPKQFIPLVGKESLLQLTCKRNRAVSDSTIIIGNVAHRDLVAEQLAGFDFLPIYESIPRNTAAAIAFAAFSVNQDDILFVTPSDHMIEADERYYNTCSEAIDLAAGNKLVTFGIKPSYAETGYGYIEANGNEVLSFKEKPDVVMAEEYIAAGNYYWNSGMFCFKAGVFLSELKSFEPEIFNSSLAAFTAVANREVPEPLSKLIPSKSIDYAVMERSQEVAVVPATFTWSDLGSFDALADFLASPTGATGNLIISDRHVEVIGLNDLIIIDTPDALLVMPKGQSQDVKAIYTKLEANKPELVQ